MEELKEKLTQDISPMSDLMEKYFEEYLPAIDKKYKSEAGKLEIFKDFTILLIQHQLGNHVVQVNSLFKLGLKPSNLYWLDIPYTSNKVVREYIQKNYNVPEENFIKSNLKLLEPYNEYQRKRVQEIYKTLLKKSPKKLLVLDDGAYFLEAMTTYKNKFENIGVVEQTTRGIIKISCNSAMKLAQKQVNFFNVAESIPKKTLEPYFIAYSVLDSLLKRIKTLKNVNQQPYCLILGFGSIGMKVADRLSSLKYPNIYIYDTDHDRQSEIEKKYILFDKDDLTERVDLVIGCSGSNSFGIGDYIYLKDNAILVSASSGAVELSRQDFIELADSHKKDDIKLIRKNLNKNSLFSDITFEFLGKKATFLNGGFPINFDGRVNNLPLKYIQPTNVMMIEATRILTEKIKRKEYKFSDTFNNWITHKFKKIMKDESNYVKKHYLNK